MVNQRPVNEKENQSVAEERRAMQKQLHAAQLKTRRLEQKLADATNQAVDEEADKVEDARPRNRKRKKRTTELPDSGSDSDTHAARAALTKPPRKRTRHPAKKAKEDDMDEEEDNEHPHGTPTSKTGMDNDSPSPSPPPASRRVPRTTEIQEWGKIFAINYSPWLIDDSVFSMKLKPGIGDKHGTRFVKKQKKFLVENLIQGQLRDLLQVIPQEYQWLREDKDFQTHFNYGMQSMRQAWAKRLRSQGTEKIFGKCADAMDDSEERFDAFADLIGYDPALAAKGAPYSALRAPILHTRELSDKTFKKEDVFTRKELKTTWIGLLRGAPAAKQFRTQNRSTTVSPKVYQSIFHIRYTMRAHPATAAVLTCWALSADIELTRMGDRTEIDWLEHFHEYLSVIHRAVESKCVYTRKMFREWDAEVFNTAHSPYGGDGPVDESAQVEDHDEAMAQYDDPEDNPEENNVQPEQNGENDYEDEDP